MGDRDRCSMGDRDRCRGLFSRDQVRRQLSLRLNTPSMVKLKFRVKVKVKVLARVRVEIR
jgi:hypothetical protein